MKTVTIYGASDDLVEVDGAIHEEFNPPYSSGDDEKPSFLAFSDGTVLEIRYNGFWRINRLETGSAAYEKHEGTNEETDYSDRVTLSGDLRWVVFGSGFERAKR